MWMLPESSLAGRGKCLKNLSQSVPCFLPINGRLLSVTTLSSTLVNYTCVCLYSLVFLQLYWLCLQSSLRVLLQHHLVFFPKERRLRSRSQKNVTTNSIARGRLIRPVPTWPGWPSSRNRGRTLPRREKSSGKVRKPSLEFALDSRICICGLFSNIHLKRN